LDKKPENHSWQRQCHSSKGQRGAHPENHTYTIVCSNPSEQKDNVMTVPLPAFSITFSVSGNLSRIGGWRHNWSNTFPFKIY
jgi:hypothetical protein